MDDWPRRIRWQRSRNRVDCWVGFLKGFSTLHNIKAWEKVGAVPFSRKCLQSPKVRRSIGDGNNEQQALVDLIVEHNVIACNALTLEGYNGDVMKITLKPVEYSSVFTVPHSQERIELLSQAKSHGNIFAATGGVHSLPIGAALIKKVL